MFSFFTYRPQLWLVLLISNFGLVVLPMIGILLYGVTERNTVLDVESALRLQGAQWATLYRSETLALKNRDALLRNYPVFAQRDKKYTYGVFGMRSPQLDPRILQRILGRERSDDNTLYPKLTCKEIDSSSDDLAQGIGDKLQQLLDQRPSDGASIRILDNDGFVVAQNRESNKCGRLLIEENPSFLKVLDGIDRASLHRNEKSQPPWWTMLISHWGTLDVVVRYPVNMKNESTGEDHVLALVLLSQTPDSMLDLLRSELNNTEIWIFSVILALSLAIVTVFLTLTITRPFKAVLAQIQRAKGGERGAVVPLHHTYTRDVKDFSRNISSLVMMLERRETDLKQRESQKEELVNALKQRESQKEELVNALKRREKTTRALAFHVAHRTGNRLTSTLGSIGLLRQHAETMSAQDKEKFLSLIEKDARYLEIMAARLMELSRWDGMSVGENDQVIVEEVLRRLDKDTDFPRFSLHVESSAKGQSVGMEAQWLESIVTDLINNAHEHGGEGVDIAITLDIAKHRERSLVIRVHNDGQGILPIAREQVFDPFFTTSKSRANSGLGLAIVKEILTAHKGTIELVDTDTGVTFEIVLPIQKLN